MLTSYLFFRVVGGLKPFRVPSWSTAHTTNLMRRKRIKRQRVPAKVIRRSICGGLKFQKKILTRRSCWIMFEEPFFQHFRLFPVIFEQFRIEKWLLPWIWPLFIVKIIKIIKICLYTKSFTITVSKMLTEIPQAKLWFPAYFRSFRPENFVLKESDSFIS